MKIFLSMYVDKKLEHKELRSHYVCLTTDTWTLVQNINYMVLTAHFIDDDRKMHKKKSLTFVSLLITKAIA